MDWLLYIINKFVRNNKSRHDRNIKTKDISVSDLVLIYETKIEAKNEVKNEAKSGPLSLPDVYHLEHICISQCWKAKHLCNVLKQKMGQYPCHS